MLAIVALSCSWVQFAWAYDDAVVVFDFVGDTRSGDAIADSLRLRLARHEEFFVLDQIATTNAVGGKGLHDIDESVADIARRLGCNLAIVGRVKSEGPNLIASVECLDISADGRSRSWSKEFRHSGPRASGLIAREIVETLRSKPEWTPPQIGDERMGDNLSDPVNVNGDFDAGHAGWDRPDNVSTMIEPSDGAGMCVRMRTDLHRDDWLKYQRDLLFGRASPDDPPDIPTITGGESVAAAEGVHYKSQYIKATPGARYWLSAKFKGDKGGKIFVKGFANFAHLARELPEVSMVEMDLTPESFAAMDPSHRAELIKQDARKHPMRYLREVYRWHLNCPKTNKWVALAEVFPPRKTLSGDVHWLQIQLYAYWPAGSYYFDDVHLRMIAPEAVDEQR